MTSLFSLRRAFAQPEVFQKSFRAAGQALSTQLRSARTAAAPYALKNHGYAIQICPGLKAVNRRVISDRSHKRWDRRLRHHLPKSELKVLQRKEAEKLRARNKFKTMVSYILKRRERGF